MPHTGRSALTEEEPAVDHTADRKASLRILVLDDDRYVRKLWVHDLSEAGYAVQGAGRGEEALRALVDFAPSLILTDLVVPSVEGFQLLTRLRQAADFAHIPVLFVSALAEDVCQTLLEQLPARRLGSADILSRPILQKALIERVRQIIDTTHGLGG